MFYNMAVMKCSPIFSNNTDSDKMCREKADRITEKEKKSVKHFKL